MRPRALTLPLEMSDAKREVEDLRQELVRVDGQILAGLEKRAKLSRRVGELRKDQPAQLPLTEKAQISTVVARASGDMPAEDLRVIFAHVYASCLALELPVKVAYPGPEGGAAHSAVRARFGAGVELHVVEGVPATLAEVTAHRAEFGVVPIETMADGPVQGTIAALVASDLKIVSAIEVATELCLANRTGNDADVDKVYATASDHARGQNALAALARRVTVFDVKTPHMACQLAAEDHGAAALCTEDFAAEQGLAVARRGMEQPERIRYAIVGSRPGGRTGDDATACVFSVNDAPGALLSVLKLFAERGVSLKNIQSRPARGEEWVYLFFVELTGHATDRALVTAFDDVRKQTRFFKVLGSYPAL